MRQKIGRTYVHNLLKMLHIKNLTDMLEIKFVDVFETRCTFGISSAKLHCLNAIQLPVSDGNLQSHTFHRGWVHHLFWLSFLTLDL